MKMTPLLVCASCLTEACAAGNLMCEDARTASLVYIAAARRDRPDGSGGRA